MSFWEVLTTVLGVAFAKENLIATALALPLFCTMFYVVLTAEKASYLDKPLADRRIRWSSYAALAWPICALAWQVLQADNVTSINLETADGMAAAGTISCAIFCLLSAAFWFGGVKSRWQGALPFPIFFSALFMLVGLFGPKYIGPETSNANEASWISLAGGYGIALLYVYTIFFWIAFPVHAQRYPDADSEQASAPCPHAL